MQWVRNLLNALWKQSIEEIETELKTLEAERATLDEAANSNSLSPSQASRYERLTGEIALRHIHLTFRPHLRKE